MLEQLRVNLFRIPLRIAIYLVHGACPHFFGLWLVELNEFFSVARTDLKSLFLTLN